jgi:hypothetical protein
MDSLVKDLFLEAAEDLDIEIYLLSCSRTEECPMEEDMVDYYPIVPWAGSESLEDDTNDLVVTYENF